MRKAIDEKLATLVWSIVYYDQIRVGKLVYHQLFTVES